MEELVLIDPKVTQTYKVLSLLLNWKSPSTTPDGTPQEGLVVITLEDNHGILFSHQYVGPAAIDMMKWLNTANFTVNSMHKRILQKLSVDGVLPGTVSGTPDPPTVEF